MVKKRRKMGAVQPAGWLLLILAAAAVFLVMIVQGGSVKIIGALSCFGAAVLLLKKRRSGGPVPFTLIWGAFLAAALYFALSLIWAKSGSSYIRELTKLLIAFAAFAASSILLKNEAASFKRAALLGALFCAVFAFLCTDSLSVGVFDFLLSFLGLRPGEASFEESYSGLFMAGAFLSAYLLDSAETRREEDRGAALLSFSLFGFVLTCNYGTIIAFVPAFVLWLVFSRGNRALSFLRFSGALVSSLVLGTIACAFLGGKGVLSALPLAAILLNALGARELSVILCGTIRRHGKYKLPIFFAVFLILLMFVIIFFVYKEDLSHSFGQTELTRDGLALFRQSPVIGLGSGGFEAMAKTVQLSAYSDKYVGNQIVQTLLEGGVVGLALYALLFIVALITLLRRKSEGQDSLRPALMGALVSSALCGFFCGVLINGAFVLILGLILGLTSFGFGQPLKTPTSRIIRFASVALAAVFTVLLLLSAWAGSTASHLGSGAGAFKKLRACIAVDLFDGDAWRAEYIKKADLSEDNYYTSSVIYGDRLLKTAETGSEEELMTFFMNYSDFERAADFALHACKYNRLSPEVWETYFEYCYQYSMNGFGVMINLWEKAFYACGGELMAMYDEVNSLLEEPMDIDDKYDVEYREYLINSAQLN